MENLAGYGSDDDYEENSQPKKGGWLPDQPTNSALPPEQDANYDEVQMDLSEGSDDSRGGNEDGAKRPQQDSRSRTEEKSKRDHRDRNGDRKKHRDDRGRSERSGRDDRDAKHSRSRDSREKYRDDRDNSRQSGREDRGRSYRDRRSRRSSSRERQRSRSPKRPDNNGKGAPNRPGYYNKKFDRANRMDRIEKMGIEIKPSPNQNYEIPEPAQKPEQEKDRFFMAGITGRFTEQIQRRKMLWQKKEPEKATATVSHPLPSIVRPSVSAAHPSASGGGKLWENTTFAQDTDGKVANKFKRLMGIRSASESEPASRPTTDLMKKQEEMFTSMEAQYEVARTATHTMRGVGLGFGSFQR